MIFGAILAGGSGTRLDNHDIPKQFIELCGKPIIIHVVEKMLSIKKFDYIYIAINVNYKEYLRNLLSEAGLGSENRIIIVDGGRERIDSIQNVVDAAFTKNQDENDIIVLQDAVRPFTTVEILENCISTAIEYGGAIAVTPAVDTMIVSLDGVSLDSVPNRKTLYHGQAPEGFRLGNLKNAIESLSPQERLTITGSSQICTTKGFPVKLFEGSTKNMKITVENDLLIAEAICRHEETLIK